MMRHPPTKGIGCWGRRCHHLRRSQYLERTDLSRCCGYSATREQAMADFKKQWLSR